MAPPVLLVNPPIYDRVRPPDLNPVFGIPLKYRGLGLGNFFSKPLSNNSEPMVSDGISDAECVRRLQGGETEVFEILVRRHQKAIFNLVYRMLDDYDEAAEIAQETFLSAYRAIGRFRGEANFSTWLYRIALNHASTRRKSMVNWQRRTVPLETTGPVYDRSLDPAEIVEQKENRDRVQEALNSLEPGDAMIILLKDLQDIPYEEVARVLQIPIGTVKSRLHRARQALKSRLSPYFNSNRTKL
jgi:RNA polymerase sigma-70 factor, ECF subfamily